jgi:hypothetical protein
VGESMNYLVRKPDAGNPHVRFDERGVETESMASYSGTSNRKDWSPLRLRLNFTAPLLDSTKSRMSRCRQFSEQLMQELTKVAKRYGNAARFLRRELGGRHSANGLGEERT